jgi:hypothetical protein
VRVRWAQGGAVEAFYRGENQVTTLTTSSDDMVFVVTVSMYHH